MQIITNRKTALLLTAPLEKMGDVPKKRPGEIGVPRRLPRCEKPLFAV
nr:MAG TPA_asm: hypothetical protein [Caudoviricetes sp.]